MPHNHAKCLSFLKVLSLICSLARTSGKNTNPFWSLPAIFMESQLDTCSLPVSGEVMMLPGVPLEFLSQGFINELCWFLRVPRLNSFVSLAWYQHRWYQCMHLRAGHSIIGRASPQQHSAYGIPRTCNLEMSYVIISLSTSVPGVYVIAGLSQEVVAATLWHKFFLILYWSTIVVVRSGAQAPVLAAPGKSRMEKRLAC